MGDKGDRCLVWEIGNRVLWGGERRSLVDVGNRRSGFVGGEGRSHHATLMIYK